MAFPDRPGSLLPGLVSLEDTSITRKPIIQTNWTSWCSGALPAWPDRLKRSGGGSEQKRSGPRLALERREAVLGANRIIDIPIAACAWPHGHALAHR